MKSLLSPYYPPRARWYSPLLLMPRGVLRQLALDRIRLPSGIPFFRVLWSLLVPGLGIYLRGSRLWGQVAMGVSALLALIFVAGLGSPVGNVAFGLLLSIHVTGVVYALEPWLAGECFRTRLLFSACALFLLAGLCYMPLRNLVQEHWLMPLRVKGRVVVVSRLARTAHLERGEWIAYAYEPHGQHGVVVREGISLGPVLAVPGDQVRFGESAFEVNGVPQPRLPNMPLKGQWVVPQGHWFLWPEVVMSGHGNVAPEAIADALWQMGTVTKSQIIGRPFKRWLWRRQLSA